MDIDRVIIDRLRVASDARGFVFEPLDASGLAGQGNVHIVVTQPGAIRGNHFHNTGTEVTAVAGPARVAWREESNITTVDVPANEVWRFSFPPRIPHAFQNTSDQVMVIASFNTEPHDPAHPDTTRDVVLEG